MATLTRTFLAPHCVSFFSPSGSLTATLPVPRTTIDLRFLLPITAPVPVRPGAREVKVIGQANFTMFSPARPMVMVCSLLSPSSALMVSSNSPVPMPQ